VFWIAGIVLSIIGCFKEPRVLAAVGIGLAILNYISLPDLTLVKAFWTYYMTFNNLF
jgi:hypothetical protein